jgi:hypothetical protein
MEIKKMKTKTNLVWMWMVVVMMASVVMSFIPASVCGVTINFDTYPDGTSVAPGTLISDQYALWGVTFSSPGGPPIASDGDGYGGIGGQGSSDPHWLIGNSGPFSPITIDFEMPPASVTLALVSVGDATATVTAYASDYTTTLDSVSVSNPGTGVGYMKIDWVTLNGPDISRIHFEISNSYSYDGIGIDDVSFTVSLGEIPVDIDIKPGSDSNPINPDSKGLVPVAIFSSPEFDATQVDPTSISLAGAGVAVRGKDKLMAHEEDVNNDGLIDLVVQVETQNFTDLSDGGTVELAGATFGGQAVVGYDEVIIVPPE